MYIYLSIESISTFSCILLQCANTDMKVKLSQMERNWKDERRKRIEAESAVALASSASGALLSEASDASSVDGVGSYSEAAFASSSASSSGTLPPPVLALPGTTATAFTSSLFSPKPILQHSPSSSVDALTAKFASVRKDTVDR